MNLSVEQGVKVQVIIRWTHSLTKKFHVGFAIIFLLLIGLDLYAFLGLKLILVNHTAWLKNSIYIAYWLVSLSLPLLFMTNPDTFRRPTSELNLFVILANVWMIVGISKLVFIISLFGEDIYRFGFAIYQKLSGTQDLSSGFLPARRKFIGQTALVLASLPFLSLTYGLVKGRYLYKIHRKQIYFEDLPEEFDGFTIAQISDVHSGSLDDHEEVSKAMDMIQSLESDVIVFTGDLVNTFADEFDPWAHHFKRLEAPYGKFSVLGNHDYGHYHRWENELDKKANFDRLIMHHAATGFDLMRDESRTIEKNGQSISLLGVENWGMGFGRLGDIDKALENVPEKSFKVLLSHDPTHWEYVVKGHDKNVHLTLSGHTHGMQMGIELPGFKWSPIQYKYPKWSDLHKENNRYLYINRGFGVLGYRGRVGIWPEITHIELRKGSPDKSV